MVGKKAAFEGHGILSTYASWKPPGCTMPTLIHYELTTHDPASFIANSQSFAIPSDRISRSVCHGQELFNSSTPRPNSSNSSAVQPCLAQSIRSSVMDERLVESARCVFWFILQSLQMQMQMQMRFLYPIDMMWDRKDWPWLTLLDIYNWRLIWSSE